MKKFAITLGIAVAILVSALGIGAAIAVASDNATTQEVTSYDVSVYSLVKEYVDDFSNKDNVWSNRASVEINRVFVDKSGRIQSVDYTVYDGKGDNIGGGVVDWGTTLVNYANAQ